MFVVKTAVV